MFTHRSRGRLDDRRAVAVGFLAQDHDRVGTAARHGVGVADPAEVGVVRVGVLAGVRADEQVVLGRTVLRRQHEFEALDALRRPRCGRSRPRSHRTRRIRPPTRRAPAPGARNCVDDAGLRDMPTTLLAVRRRPRRQRAARRSSHTRSLTRAGSPRDGLTGPVSPERSEVDDVADVVRDGCRRCRSSTTQTTLIASTSTARPSTNALSLDPAASRRTRARSSTAPTGTGRADVGGQIVEFAEDRGAAASAGDTDASEPRRRPPGPTRR